MKCWYCRAEMIWGGDHNAEDYGYECNGIVTNLSCPECKAACLFFAFEDEEKENKIEN